jgi:hypothetical protein
MEIDVECYAGYRGEQEPRAFRLGERRIAVTEIVDRWLGPDYRYFRVSGDDGNLYVLRRDDAKDEWTLGAFTRGGPRPG